MAARIAISHSTDPAATALADAVPTTDKPTRSARRRPNRSASTPAATNNPANTTTYASTTACRAAVPAACARSPSDWGSTPRRSTGTFSARDDLLDLALDAVFAELPLPELSTDNNRADNRADEWADGIRAYMHGLRQALLRHPWSGALASSRPLLGPEALARSEYVYSALAGAGFTDAELVAAAAAISNLVIGSLGAEAAWRHDREALARRAMHEHLQRSADRYPTLAALDDTSVNSWEDQFTRGVDLLIAGLRERSLQNIGAEHRR